MIHFLAAISVVGMLIIVRCFSVLVFLVVLAILLLPLTVLVLILCVSVVIIIVLQNPFKSFRIPLYTNSGKKTFCFVLRGG